MHRVAKAAGFKPAPTSCLVTIPLAAAVAQFHAKSCKVYIFHAGVSTGVTQKTQAMHVRNILN